MQIDIEKQNEKGNKVFIAHRREFDHCIQELSQHLEETSTYSGKFASKIGLQKHGELIGFFHDFGKATEEFQRYIMSATGLIDPDADEYVDASKLKGKVDHSSSGAQILYRIFSNKGKEYLFASQILPLAIVSHHSGLIDCLTYDGKDSFIKRINKDDELTRLSEVESNLAKWIEMKYEHLFADDLIDKHLNNKLKSLMESNDDVSTYMFKVGLLTRFLFSCLIDADRLSTADFEFPQNKKLRNQGSYVSWKSLAEKLEDHISHFKLENKVDFLRKEISTCCLECSERPKGLFQLTVPTGGGKTLSSLRFALNHAAKHGMDRVIYIIPYTSIIDQNADVSRKILENTEYSNHIVLEHHSNLTPDEENTRQKLLAENWDAPVVFTTMVQFLETMFSGGTRNVRRMHQLANAVLIFDEIQTLPIKCIHLFNLAVRFLIQGCGATVVLCTATQPLLDKVKPEKRALPLTFENQIVQNYRQLFEELRRVKVINMQKIGGWPTEELTDLAINEVELTGSVLVIVNTRKAAQDLYYLLEKSKHSKVYHLSTHMCPAHRMDTLVEIKECLPDVAPVICVSTQLIEAGVDIDFGSVIRYTAGLDSISQAAGRCNRNGARSIPGRVLVVNPQEENLDMLKDISIGKEVALRIFDEYASDPCQFDNDIIGPKALERYYQYYFHQRTNEMNYPLGRKSKAGRADDIFNLLSANQLSLDAFRRQNLGQLPQLPLRQSFKTAGDEFEAIDSSTRGIIVHYKDEGKQVIRDLCSYSYLEKQFQLLKQAQRYSINIFSYLFDLLLKKKVIYEVQEGSGIYYLDERYYSNHCGMTDFPVNEMEVMIIGEV